MDAAGPQDCPECGAALVADPGFVTWCDRCEWNLTAPPVALTRHFERVALVAARRLDARLSGQLESTTDLRRRMTAAKAAAYAIAAVVHLLTLGLLAGGLLLLASAYTNPFADLLGVAAIAFAFVVRPRIGKPPRDGILTRKQAPTLYGLVDGVAAALRTKAVDYVVVDGSFNAWWSVSGFRRARTLTLGLPLAYSLEPQQLVALIAHELAHARNGDATRGLFVGSAVDALQEIDNTLRHSETVAFNENVALLEIASRPLLWALALPVRGVLLAEYLLLQRDSQRAEYLADALAATVAGTGAVTSLHEALLNETYVDAAIQRAAREEDGDLFGSLRTTIRSVPPRERERRRRIARLEHSRLTATHPPTARRIELLERRAATNGGVTLTASELDRIDAELATWRKEIAARLVDDYRASLY